MKAGMLDNVVIDEDGNGKIEQISDRFDLFGSYSIIGRGIVYHKKPDGGPSIACCTIGLAAPPKSYKSYGYGHAGHAGYGAGYGDAGYGQNYAGW